MTIPCPHCGNPLPAVPGLALCVKCGHWSTILPGDKQT